MRRYPGVPSDPKRAAEVRAALAGTLAALAVALVLLVAALTVR